MNKKFVLIAILALIGLAIVEPHGQVAPNKVNLATQVKGVLPTVNGGMTYPSAGVPNSTGSAWGTSLSPNIPAVVYCGGTGTCANTQETGTAILYGSVNLISGTPSHVTVSAISAPNSGHQTCTYEDNTTASNNNAIKITQFTSTSITFNGPNSVTDTIGYICMWH